MYKIKKMKVDAIKKGAHCSHPVTVLLLHHFCTTLPLLQYSWLHFERKIFFSVAFPVDCKLVRYCNIDVFLLVSHFLSCSDCSNLSEDKMPGCQFSSQEKCTIIKI